MPAPVKANVSATRGEVKVTPEIVNGLFAVAGALIGVAGAWAVSRSTRDVRKLTILQSPTAALLDVAAPVKSDVQILFKGAPVEALAIGEIAIQNTGSVAVEAVQLLVSPHADSPIADISPPTTNFGKTDEPMLFTEKSGTYTLLIPYLNPRDRVVVEYRVLGKLRAPEAVARLKGVDVQVKQDFISWLPGIYADRIAEVFLEMPLFGFVLRRTKPFSLYLEAKKGRAISNEAER